MATEEAMPGGQAYMVWLNRNGKARGTQLVWATPGRATFDESVSVRCTLYRTKEGSFLAKDFELQVLMSEGFRLSQPPQHLSSFDLPPIAHVSGVLS